MRPTSAEVLQSMRRVLAEIVIPALVDRYAIEQLNHQIPALDDLAKHCQTDIPRLMRANDEMINVLTDSHKFSEVGSQLTDELKVGLFEATRPSDRYPDYEDLNRRNNLLRRLLGSVIRAWPIYPGQSPSKAEIRTRIRSLLEDHIARSI